MLRAETQRDGPSSSTQILGSVGHEPIKRDPPGLRRVLEVILVSPRSCPSDGDVAEGTAPRNRPALKGTFSVGA